eukprot:UN00526
MDEKDIDYYFHFYLTSEDNNEEIFQNVKYVLLMNDLNVWKYAAQFYEKEFNKKNVSIDEVKPVCQDDRFSLYVVGFFIVSARWSWGVLLFLYCYMRLRNYYLLQKVKWRLTLTYL